MTALKVFNDTYSLVTANAAITPDAIAIMADGRRPLSYQELLQHVDAFVHMLQSVGVKREDRVGIVLPDGPEMSIALLGVSAAAVCAPLNPLYQKSEFVSCFSDLNIKLLISGTETDAPAYLAAKERCVPVMRVSAGDLAIDGNNLILSDDLYDKKIGGTSPTIVRPDDIAIVLQTSGTTSRPKTVPLTHRNICVSVNNVCRALELNSEDRCLNMMPQFHIGGFVDLLLSPLAVGGQIIRSSGFDTEQFFSMLQRYHPTWFQAVPAILSELLAYAKKKNLRPIVSSLRFIRSVASTLTPKLMDELESFFEVPVIQTFGMTEAAPLITTNPLPPGHTKPGSTGPSAGPDVAIMDVQGNLLPPGVIGEVVTRGDNIFEAYENNTEANREAFRHGWFHTGDTGFLDEERYLFLTGRLKEIINRGGEKISPQEIDMVLLTHPAVSQAVCFSIPHRILGEDIAAAVVLRKDGRVSEIELVDFVARQLAIFKVPRTIRFVQDIPKGPTGKPLRFCLSEKLNLTAPTLTKADFSPPTTLIEKTLAQIWTGVFKIKDISIHDNFFDMGGDSLGVVKLFHNIEKKLHVKLPLYTIFRLPTIAKLAEIIEKKGKTISQEILDDIQQSNRNPIFWIHCKFEMHEIPLIPLSTYWDSAPAKDVTGIRIEEMAADYLHQIQDHIKKGPYALGGFSIGGLIALETARQLVESGEKVSLLFLLDPIPPDEQPTNVSLKIFAYAKKIAVLKPGEKMPFLRRKIYNLIKFSDLKIKDALCAKYRKRLKPLPYILRTYYANKIFVHAAARYQPLEYPGEITIYLSIDNHRLFANKWRRICPRGDIRMIDTDDHLKVVIPPWNNIWMKDLYKKSLTILSVNNQRPFF